MRFPYILAAAVVAVACPRAAGAQVEPIDQAAAGTWSYAGPTGPAFWATRLGHAECAGPRQSPVDLPNIALSAPLNIRLGYPRASQARLVNTGHTVNLYLQDAATLQVADTTFDYKETHFHVPAEHLVHGRRHAAEVHSVHQMGNGSRAVLTTFIAEGDHNDRWDSLVNGLPGNRDDQNQIGIIDLVAMLALDGLIAERIYSYAGSLTTPLCTPNVRFLIRERTITLSRQQIDALASAFARNVRPIFSITTQVTLHGIH
jgi:carbonic anhydrase